MPDLCIFKYKSNDFVHRKKCPTVTSGDLRGIVSPDTVTVAVGSTQLNDLKFEVYKAEEFIPHERFVKGYYYKNHNIGLIKLREKIAFNEKAQPIKLPESEGLEGGYLAVSYAWTRVRTFFGNQPLITTPMITTVLLFLQRICMA